MLADSPHGIVLAFDLGGTKLAAAIIDKASGQIHRYQVVSTPSIHDSQISLNAIISLGDQLIESASGLAVNAIGVSFGGPVSSDGLTVIKSQHIAGWEHFPLPQVISSHFGLPVFMENDANAAALGEWYYGAGERLPSLVYLQTSTGIGAGMIINGRIYHGKGMAGEFGHLTIEANGLPCACGKSGCLESYSSGWGIASRARQIYPRLPADSALRALTQGDPHQVTTELVFAAYLQQDPHMRELVRSAMGSLARALVDVVCLLDPHRIVIGGGMSQSYWIMLAEMQPFINQFMPPFLRGHLDLRASSLGGKETLLGAALLTEEQFH